MAIRDQELITAFGQVLRDARKKCGFSIEELAHVAGVDRTFVHRLEAGKGQPSLSVISALSQAVGVKPGTLLDRAVKRREGDGSGR